MTVLQVLEATEGGTRRHLRDLVGALDPEAFRSVVCVSCGRDADFLKDCERYASAGVAVERIPMRREIAPFADLVSLMRLVACVRRVRPAVIHGHSAKAGFLARLAGAVCRVPVVYTPHVFPFQMDCGKGAHLLYRGLERFARRWTAVLIAVSEAERREALALGYAGRQVYTIPNGVKAGRGAGVGPARDPGVLTVGFFGRLTPQKGPDLLVEAAADVVTHLPQVRFVFYGDGEMLAALKVLAASRRLGAQVRFAGAYDQEEAVARMREVDVVAVPSRWEGCPYVVLEAFLAGVPVAAAAVGGVPDLIRHGESGLLVEAGSAEGLCDGLLTLLRDPELRARLAGQGRAAVETRTVAAMARRVEAVYREAGGERR